MKAVGAECKVLSRNVAKGLGKTTKSLVSADRICRLAQGRSEVQGKTVPGS
jgi:hypothetical protein